MPIELFTRKELPSGQAGGVKPPVSLADNSAMQNAIGAGVKFAGDTFNSIVATTAANEKAAYQGEISTALQGWDTYVTANPGASYQQLETERNKMMDSLKKAGMSATTKEAQQANSLWYKTNEGRIRGQSQSTMEAIRVKQSLATYNQLQENNIKSLAPDAKDKYLVNMENAIDNRLIDEGTAEARMIEDFEVFDSASASNIGFSTWEATGNLNDGYDAIDASGVSESAKTKAKSTLKTRVTNRRAEDKLQAEKDEFESVEKIKERLNTSQFDGMSDFINGLPLTETEKNKQIISANSYIESINNGKDGIVTSDETNIAIDRNLRDIRAGRLTYDQGIAAYKKLSGKVNSKEGKTNLDNISTAADASKDPVLTRPEVQRSHRSLERIATLAGQALDKDSDTFDEDSRAVERALRRNQDELDAWYTANADDPDITRKLQDKTDELMEPVTADVTLSLFEKATRPKGAFGRFLAGASGLGAFALLRDTEEERLAELEKEKLGELADEQIARTERLKKEGRLSGKERQAFDWAKSNPDDPRAKKILIQLGVK